MLDASALLLGIGLGLRHATDADHLAVVSAMVQREPGLLRAARIAVLWGLGHMTSFLVVGLLIVLAGLRVPEAFEQGVDLVVAAMLTVLGAWHVSRRHVRHVRAISATRPVAVGLVHGLAGSASIALLAVVAIRSPWGATLYLLLFGTGTVLGMALLTVALSRPIAWTARQEGKLGQVFVKLPGLFSLTLGIVLGLEALRSLG